MAAVQQGNVLPHGNFSLPRRPVHPPAAAARPPSSDLSYQQPASHAHSRSASSGTFPFQPSAYQQQQSMSQQQQQQHHSGPPVHPSQMQQFLPPRRTYSNATTSTNSTNDGGPQRRNSGNSLQRSTSSRSGSTPSSYVALMRRQKATVWSDRAQHEDPRFLAQQRAAKMRAAMEVSNAHQSVRASTSGSSGGVRSKIRHHGAPKAQQYTPMTHPASGVPMRLSAREVDEDISDEDHSNPRMGHHQRSGSGRSSLGSGRMSTAFNLQQQGLAMTPTAVSSESGTPPAESPAHSRGRAETQSTINSKNGPTPVPQHYRGDDYFSQRYVGPGGENSSGHSEDSSEAQFGRVGNLPQRNPDVHPAQYETDLARRGSVDDRTATMSGYKRLFIANPDVDSD